MIVTVTLNPAVDKTVETGNLVPGGLNRLHNIVLDAGGKGINVSKMIAALGGSSVATGFLGGGSGREVTAILGEMGIQTDFVPISHPTRTNLKVLSPDYGITEFNEPGAFVTAAELETLAEKLSQYAGTDTVFVFSGSLPRGVPPDTYHKLTLLVKSRGSSVFLDADGEAFRLALPAAPDCIKPNKFELMQYFSRTEDLTVTECVELARRLTGGQNRLTAVSMGAEGALFISPAEILHAPGLTVKALSTVGAGDSMVGALVYARHEGMSFREAAALAMAASAGAVTTVGTKAPERAVVEELLTRVKLQPVS